MKIGAVGLGNRIAHVYHELSQINIEAQLVATNCASILICDNS